MTEAEKISKLKILVNDNKITDEALGLYLSMAEDKILGRAYPFKDTSATLVDGTKKYKMPTKYEHLQIELASRYIFRRGFEGQLSSNEIGIARGYDSVNDEDLLCEVMQIVGVV